MSYKLIIALAPGSSTESIYEITGWKPSETLVSPYIKSSTVVDAGYKDFSSIFNWRHYGMKSNRDYKFIRARIQELYVSIGWSNLSTEEKEICCQYFVVLQVNQDEIYTIEEQIKFGETFHKKSVECRRHRSNKTSTEIYNRLQKVEADEIIDDMYTSTNLLNKYIEFGREGTVEGDPEGAFDYLESRVGTSYENTGFKNKSFVPSGMADMPEFSVYLMNILKTGDYPLT